MARRNGRRLGCERLESRILLAGEPVGGVIAPQFTINQSPRLQPGNAPLVGYAGSELDRVDVLWQTVPAGAGMQDSFIVDYRLAEASGEWQAAALNAAIDTGVEGRVVRSATITGLAWNRAYEYRVRHLRGEAIVAEYGSPFRTRLCAGDETPFSFAAYGDSASPAVDGFRAVQRRINEVSPSFAVLLGDNVYNVGTHREADARFDPLVNPEAATWMAGHIDYLGFGNHDVATAAGLPSEQSYSVPVPVAGVTAPAAPPASERSEHSFSWDYGSVHFVTFDTNSLSSPTRLDGLLDWVVADLAASSARWKIVYGHHPLAGVPDKPESPAGNYYQQVVNRLKAAGVDLFMTGHSHTYSWTYPLKGQVEGVATFADHGDHDHFHAGEGLTQLVSGMGGAGIRAGDYGQFPFVAAGFSASTAVAARLGFSKIDVTPNALTVSYIAADDGSVIDAFTVEKEAVQTVSFQQGVAGYRGVIDTVLHEDAPRTAFAAAASLKVDADNPTGSMHRAQALVRFENLFGSGPGQIPLNAQLRSATLELKVGNGGNNINLHRMASRWAATDTWQSRVNGIQADGSEAVAFPDTSTGAVDVGTLSFDVLASLRAWQVNPAANRGWVLMPTGADGVDVDSAEGATPPKLVVTFIAAAAAAPQPTRFFVVDGVGGTVARHAANGAAIASSLLPAETVAPRGIAASPDGSRLWVIGAGGTVTVFDVGMARLGSWTAAGLPDPTGIAVVGRDLYVSDRGLGRIVVFSDAVARLAGSQLSSRSFALSAANGNPQDLVTDGRFVWVVQSAAVDKVFVYRATTGVAVGSWSLARANRSPTGITIDPTGRSQSIWVVDGESRRVFEYAAGRMRRFGAAAVASAFRISPTVIDPQGIADPPVSQSVSRLWPQPRLVAARVRGYR